MSLQGKIISISEDKKYAKVLVKPRVNCNGCKACAGIIKSSKAFNSECEVDAYTNDFNIKQGDNVILEMTEYQGSKLAFVLYGIPIICFMLGLLIAPYFCIPFNIEVTDLCRIIGSFIGLLLSFLIILMVRKFSQRNTFIMSITEIC